MESFNIIYGVSTIGDSSIRVLFNHNRLRNSRMVFWTIYNISFFDIIHSRNGEGGLFGEYSEKRTFNLELDK